MNTATTLQSEFLMHDDEVVITRTDEKSHITFANEGFLRTSGYSLEEVMGKPQNLVRHPDMPKEAFADMWRTIKAGEPWTGFVKNRRKNGQFYWVHANVTPIEKDGRIAGYVSVRVKPSRKDVEAAEALYAKMRTGSLKGLRLSGGELHRTGAAGLYEALMRLSFATRSAMVAATLAFFIALPGLALWLLPAWAAKAAALSALVGIPFCAVVAVYLSTQIALPVEHMLETAKHLLAGNLRSDFALEGDFAIRKLARFLNQHNAKTLGVLDDTVHGIEHMRNAAAELDRGNHDMSSRTEEQAANLEQTAATMEEITQTVAHSAESARKANDVADAASGAAARGGEAIERVTTTMDGITATSRRIADIINVIDGIAFQTNILALNAAVEAARAGEQGRGFAVVAGEVRSLAQRAATASKEIHDLIQESVSRVDDGARIVKDAQGAMKDIVQQVDRVSAHIADISQDSRHQSESIGQINAAVSQLDEVTQSNAALVEQSAASASALNHRAGRLSEAVGVLFVASK